VLYLSALPFNDLGFKKVTGRPLPSYTWAALRFVPFVFIAMGSTLSFISWFTHRKARLRKEAEAKTRAHIQQKEDRP